MQAAIDAAKAEGAELVIGLGHPGDGFNMFECAVNVIDYVMEDYMVVVNYVTAFEGGIVEVSNSPLAARYPGMLINYAHVNGSGRIVVEAAN